jgi:CPA2 family monovalent cation:H+ antiporter-2
MVLLIKEIVIILALSAVMIFIFNRLKLPSILGLLITGMLAGPYGLGFISDLKEVDILEEIGIIFLLFIIGIEFSLKNLISIRKTVLIAGSTQVLVSALVFIFILLWFGLTLPQAIFTGFLFSFSSTAIVLKILQEKDSIKTPHGKIAVGILIFQDLAVVPMILFTPFLAGHTPNLWITAGWLILKIILVIFVILFGGRYLIPKVVELVVRTKSKELFIMTIMLICFAVAWATHALGLSLALGAFFAGLIISESDYRHQAAGNIMPFREIFISFFFVSIGMLLDIVFLKDHLLIIVLLTLMVIVLKVGIASLAARILKYPLRTSLLVGLSLFQIGEFAFILSEAGIENNLLTPDNYQYFLSIALLTMGITPFIMGFSEPIIGVLLKARPASWKQQLVNISKTKNTDIESTDLSNHLVIIGFGINGKNVANVAQMSDIPYAVIELDPYIVKAERKSGFVIIYGDATEESILRHINIEQARVVVIAISDIEATRKIIFNIRQLNKACFIIVRTHYVHEIDHIIELGADEVIPEEFETSIEIFTRVLHQYMVPQNKIEIMTDQIRSGNYEMLRTVRQHYKN